MLHFAECPSVWRTPLSSFNLHINPVRGHHGPYFTDKEIEAYFLVPLHHHTARRRWKWDLNMSHAPQSLLQLVHVATSQGNELLNFESLAEHGGSIL